MQITDIWNCILKKQDNLYVISGLYGNASDAIQFNTYDRSIGTPVLVSEALSVSWNFSDWDTSECKDPRAVPAEPEDETADGEPAASEPATDEASTETTEISDEPMGIFPLTPQLADQYGVLDRCNSVANIAAAARAVAGIEATPPTARPAPKGKPFLPMIGGWQTMPAALGGIYNEFAKNGPPERWVIKNGCSAFTRNFLIRAARPGSPFADLASSTELPADLSPYIQWFSQMANTSTTGAFQNTRCANAPPAALASFMGEQAANLAAHSEIRGADNYHFDREAMLGLANWYGKAAQRAKTDVAVWGGKYSVIPRLSYNRALIAQGTRNTQKAPVAIASRQWLQKAADWAVFYGGLLPDKNTFGARTGLLAANPAGLLGITPVLNNPGSYLITGTQKQQAVVQAAVKWVGTPYAWGGGNLAGPTKGIRDGGVADAHGDYKKIGFDCSGLMLYAYGTIGVHLPRVSRNQAEVGKLIDSVANALPGDLLFYNSPVTHVAMYIGNGQMVEAPQSGSYVQVVPVRAGTTYIRRIIEAAPPTTAVEAAPATTS